MRRFFIMLISTIFILSSLALAQDRQVDVKEIVKKIDELYRSESSYGELEMKVVTPNWERTLSMEVWTKGMDKTFIVINSPKKEKGVATLRIKNEMWNYLPKTSKVMKIPPSMMMGSWMGSDFTNDDLVHEFSMLEDYHYKLITPENAEPHLYYIEFIPKEGLPVVWGKIISAIRKEDYIPVWQNFYDEKGRLMRVLNFKDIKVFDDRKIPSVMELIPQNKESHKTIIKYLDAEFNANIDDDIFSLQNLRRKR